MIRYEKVTKMLHDGKFHEARELCIALLYKNRLNGQAWVYLCETMIGLHQGKMAHLCFNRATHFNPTGSWIDTLFQQINNEHAGKDDKEILNLLKVTKVTVTATILTKNNERTIKSCIDALTDAVDKLVVVDTGSTDNTISIIKSFGIQVHHFEWCDDFSAARNYALSLVKTPWVIFVDSDEILYHLDHNEIRTVAGMYNEGLHMINLLQMNRIGDSVQGNPIARMFKTNAGFAWRYPIHEEVFSSQNNEVSSHMVRIRVHHDSYDPQATDQTTKLERNIKLLFKHLNEETDDIRRAFIHFYLGRELTALQRNDEAVKHLESALESELKTFNPKIHDEIKKRLNMLQESMK